jgi:diguanylate cyclase (GGDEF)-like protein
MGAEAMRRAMQVDLESTSAQQFFTLPIIWKGQLVGVVCLGYPAPAALGDEDIAHIRDYADRVGVALSTATREGQLYHQARTDTLTGLPNRFFFMDRLQQDIVQAEREERKLALLFIDLDRFKGINDSLGHAAGDELLRQVAARLRQGTREGDTVARLGGDEFTILINALGSAKAAGSAAEHVIAVLSRPFIVENVENVVSASIGIAVYPSDGGDAELLMREADTAMYRAKAGGRGHYVFFEEAMNAEVVRRSSMERELRRAISERQFILHYQPQVDPHAGRIRGVEALVRWQHPEQGMIAPGHFIGIAEETGLIPVIGELVLVEACKQFSAWRNNGLELEYVSVNVSARQFRLPNFVQTVEAALRNNAMPAECLELEITESVLLDDTGEVMEMLARLKGFGVKIAIDDFGTGYSSLGYLERLPFDTLKIDISFVRNIRENGAGGAIAAMITAMAHSLGKSVVAEGVETQAQLDFLRNLDCELIQGFFYSRPLSAQELVALVTRGLPHWPASPSAVAECADPYPAGGANADERVRGS